jgi:hypothetical protein
MANRALPSRANFLANHLTPADPNSLPEDRGTCVICQEDYLKPADGEEQEPCVRLPQPCGHTVGERCIRKWFDTQDANGWFNNRCPYNCDPVYERTDYATELGANELRRRDEAGIPPPVIHNRPSAEEPEEGREVAAQIREDMHRTRRFEDLEVAERYSQLPWYDQIPQDRDQERQVQDELYLYLFGRVIGPHHNYRTIEPRPSRPSYSTSRRQQYQPRPASPDHYETLSRCPTSHGRSPSLSQYGQGTRAVQGNDHGFSHGGSELRRDSYSGRLVPRDSYSGRFVPRDTFASSGYTIGHMDSDRPTHRYDGSSAPRSSATSYGRAPPPSDSLSRERENLLAAWHENHERLENVRRQLREFEDPRHASRHNRSPTPDSSRREHDHFRSGTGDRRGRRRDYHGY